MPELLSETPDNPIPANAVAGMLAMPDGKRLRYARFAAEGRPLKGTVVIITGRNEFIEKYFETIGDLSRRGLGSAIFDLRGQGRSDRLLSNPHRGYINDFQDYAGDVGVFLEEIVLPDCRPPYFLLAHSTGALVALVAAPLLANRIQRTVLLAPLLGFPGKPSSIRAGRFAASALHALGLGLVYMGGGPPARIPTPFERNVLTTDPKRYARNLSIVRHHPGLGLGGPTASWVRAVALAIERVNEPDFVANLHIPTLVIAAGADSVVDNGAIERYARRLRSGSIVTVDGARHELLQETDIFREQVLAAFDAFIPGSGQI